MKNTVYSNDSSGIFIDNNSSDNNYIMTNNIWGVNQDYGIRIFDGDRNTINSNYIHNNQKYGIRFSGSASTNYITKNTVYSNDSGGIYINSDTANNNYVFTNNIYGTNQDYGIVIDNANNTIVKFNHIHNNGKGIYLEDTAISNYIIRNTIYSNNIYGIEIWGDSPNNNYILTNIIYGKNQNRGINITHSDNNKIYRNLIHNNLDYGIYIEGTAENIIIINNTIVGSETTDGVLWSGTSCGTMYNNIILSNGNGGDYGVNNTGTGLIYGDYNIVYGNNNGTTNNNGGGTLIWGYNNKFDDPLIETVSSFTITSLLSPAVDNAKSIPGVTDITNGYAPDMGWKESLFDTSVIPSITVSKSVYITNSPIYVQLGGNVNDPVPGAKIVYTINYSNSGHGTAYTIIFSDLIQLEQDYISNSITLNGFAVSDLPDADEGDYNAALPGGINVVITNLAPTAKGVLKYEVYIK